jgi:hypothetical protein
MGDFIWEKLLVGLVWIRAEMKWFGTGNVRAHTRARAAAIIAKGRRPVNKLPRARTAPGTMQELSGARESGNAIQPPRKKTSRSAVQRKLVQFQPLRR